MLPKRPGEVYFEEIVDILSKLFSGKKSLYLISTGNVRILEKEDKYFYSKRFKLIPDIFNFNFHAGFNSKRKTEICNQILTKLKQN